MTVSDKDFDKMNDLYYHTKEKLEEAMAKVDALKVEKDKWLNHASNADDEVDELIEENKRLKQLYNIRKIKKDGSVMLTGVEYDFVMYDEAEAMENDNRNT